MGSSLSSATLLLGDLGHCSLCSGLLLCQVAVTPGVFEMAPISLLNPYVVTEETGRVGIRCAACILSTVGTGIIPTRQRGRPRHTEVKQRGVATEVASGRAGTQTRSVFLQNPGATGGCETGRTRVACRSAAGAQFWGGGGGEGAGRLALLVQHICR